MNSLKYCSLKSTYIKYSKQNSASKFYLFIVPKSSVLFNLLFLHYKIQVKVECTPSDMLVTLNLARDFRGRIYATGNPQACFELGSGQSEMTLRIPLGTQCGTVQQVS